MYKTNDIQYLAGLLEGEGCFGFHNVPTIQICMTDIEPIRRTRNIMAPKLIVREKNAGHYRRQYYIYLSGQLAVEWMMTLYILMSPRRKERIKFIIEKWKTIKANGHSASNRAYHLRVVA